MQNQKSIDIDYSKKMKTIDSQPTLRPVYESTGDFLTKAANKQPNVIASLLGKHVQDCKCEYCEPMESQKHGVEVAKREDDTLIAKSADAILSMKFAGAPPSRAYYQPNKVKTKANMKFESDTPVREKEMLERIQKQDDNLPKMDHPYFPKEDIAEAKRICDKWQKICDEEDKAVEDTRVMQEAEILAQKIVEEQASKPLKGILSIFVNVGNITPSQAEEICEKYKTKWFETLRRIPDDWDVICVPTRTGETRIEQIRF